VWFYDDIGSRLFDDITRLPEYYPTRAERRILELHAADIVWESGCDTLVELGSGTSTKTLLLLDAFRDAECLDGFVPFDVSADVLRSAADAIADAYGCRVRGVVGDFNHHLDRIPRDGRRLVAFLGGTIGNLGPPDRARFLGELVATFGPRDRLLLGTDLVKPVDRLLAAYDDAAGVTAAFNRNALVHLNRVLDADFDPAGFAHVARWADEAAWVEMRLQAVRLQVVRVRALDVTLAFAEGDDLLTEISAKFTREGVAAELAGAGLSVMRQWTDPDGDFLLTLAGPAD
jgi:L-histidine N-alpha-methyltransferase